MTPAVTGTRPQDLVTSASLTCLEFLSGGRPLAPAGQSSYEVELKSKNKRHYQQACDKEL